MASKVKFYAVRVGRVPGIYGTWDECSIQVKGFPGAKFQKFLSKAEAEAFVTMANSSKQASASEANDKSDSKQESSESFKSKGKKRTHDEFKACDLISEINDSVVDPQVVYSDGACKGNGKSNGVAGIGVWWGEGDPRNLAERCPGGQTNNRAELIAIARVLETTPFRRGRLTIKTDSRYSIDCFDKWLGGWQNNGWLTAEKKAVKNAELIRYIAALLEARVRIGQKVFLEYVRGHVGIQGNEGADRLANMGCTMSEVEERDWESLRQDYMAKVEDLIAARKLQLAQKDQRGIIEVVGAKEASEDLQKEIETEEGTEASNKVRRVGEVAGAGVKDSPVVRGQATRTYSAGIAKPSDEVFLRFTSE
ncbi:ribonuclease H-like protein [Gymnopus androsaceus JB14]|uniref:Ribonuclease H n=1 Tax=Gymnopus androsaceus JB14 TaxID=1447944 RepID=A0A6A4ILB5_9AGAR|nr:ribonuclease H-like protein [Gymnopus androsaceus JB14]